MKGARLDGANLEGANLSPLELSKERILNADLSQIKGRSLNCNNADMRGVKFQGAELTGSSFIKAKLDPDALAETHQSATRSGPKAA